MALEGFRPTIWSKQVIVDTEKALVFRNVANTDYEGEITGGGNIVKINEIGDINVGTYTEDTDITFQTLTDAQKELHIDQQKYFAYGIDSVLKAQSNVELMTKANKKSAHAIANTIDVFLAGKYTEAGLPTSNIGTASSSVALYATASGELSMLNLITYAHRYMDEGDCPTEGRWMVVPSFMHQYLKQAQIVDNTTGAMKGGDTSSFGNGFIGNSIGFNFFASNNVSNDGTQYRVMFGTPDALSYAGQVSEIKAGEKEKQFGDFVKGLFVYGAKVVRPDHLGVAYVTDSGLTT